MNRKVPIDRHFTTYLVVLFLATILWTYSLVVMLVKAKQETKKEGLKKELLELWEVIK